MKGLLGLISVVAVACAPRLVVPPSEEMVRATGGAAVEEAVSVDTTIGAPTPASQSPHQNTATPPVEMDRRYVNIANVSTISIPFVEDDVVAFSVTSLKELPSEGAKVLVQIPAQDSTPSLYHRQANQYGQFERQEGDIVRDGNRFLATVRATGDFLVELFERGIEDTFPQIPILEDGFTRFPEESGYGVQSLSEILPLKAGTCGAQHGKKLRFYDTNRKWYLEFGGDSVREYTLDTSFPNKPIVVMSHGGGSEFRTPRYHRFANYTRHVREDASAKTVRDNISRFVPHGWITRDGPLRAAQIYQQDVRACIDPGTPIIELAHSLSGFKTAAAHLIGDAALPYHSLGIIALGTPWGGTHLGLIEAVQEGVSRDYDAQKLYGITVGLLMDYGAIDASYSSRPFVEVLTGTSLSTLNEGWRSTAFGGMWTGIPTQTYKWYSRHHISDGRYLSLLLQPKKRLTTPCTIEVQERVGNFKWRTKIVPLGNVEEDIPPGASRCYYNFAEGLLSELDRAYGYRDGFRKQPVDIIAGYFSGKDISEKREAFLARFRGIRQVITYASALIQGEKEKLEEEALPFTASLLGSMASVDPRRPNANTLSDGASFLEGPLKKGESVLVSGSTFRDLKVDEIVYQARKPGWARKMVALKDVHHGWLATGDPDGRVFSLVDQFITERMEPLREEERTTVFTQEDELFLEEAFFADSGERTCDYQTGECIPNYGVTITKVVQDPDKRNEMNRVRITLQNTSGWKYGYGEIKLDMVKRLGIWRVLTPSSPTQPS